MNKPFLLKPAYKDYLWGGTRLNDDFAKDIDVYPLAETWECSTHPDGPSIVASGEFSGESLSKVIKEHPEFLGEHLAGADELPILVKFIDAKEDLSVQVHPDDEYARIYENGKRGKTEMWYVLDASKEASLIYGLRHTLSGEQLKQAACDGSIEKYMQKVPVRKDDVFFIEAGTIHAIGKGALIAEIQENSNLTYRLYDYNRTDSKGNKRELHIEKALQVANLNVEKEPKQPMRILNYKPGMANELLGRCKYFEVYRMLINTERRQKVTYSADSVGFKVLLCINGCGVLSFGKEKLNIYKGDCIFIPAASETITIHGCMQFLDIRG